MKKSKKKGGKKAIKSTFGYAPMVSKKVPGKGN